jgi:hypothetical protein
MKTALLTVRLVLQVYEFKGFGTAAQAWAATGHTAPLQHDSVNPGCGRCCIVDPIRPTWA